MFLNILNQTNIHLLLKCIIVVCISVAVLHVCVYCVYLLSDMSDSNKHLISTELVAAVVVGLW